MFQKSSQRYIKAELSVSSLPSLATNDVIDAIDFMDIIWSLIFMDTHIQITISEISYSIKQYIYILKDFWKQEDIEDGLVNITDK